MQGAGNICSAWFLDIRIYKLVYIAMRSLVMCKILNIANEVLWLVCLCWYYLITHGIIFAAPDL